MANNTTSANATVASSARSGGNCPVHLFTETEKWLQVSSFLIIVVVSIFGNTVVICIIKKNRRLHSPTNYFIVNLCLANLMIMFLNTSPDILGRIALHLGFVVSGKCTEVCLVANVLLAISLFTYHIAAYLSLFTECPGRILHSS